VSPIIAQLVSFQQRKNCRGAPVNLKRLADEAQIKSVTICF
jgi:hypothetical protein